MNQLDFKNRNVVITGGAAGIGLAIAERLLNSGARVMLWDRDENALNTARAAFLQQFPDNRCFTHPLDVTLEAQVNEAARASIAALGKVDALVCSAGITGPNKSVVDYSYADWQQVFAINTHGVFLCNRALVPHMVANDYGRIVNIASIAGKEGNPNASAYSASKAAVIALTKSLGKELAKTKITVNCVTPAAVRTGMFEQMTPQFIEFMLSKIPMGRFGLTTEIASLVSWLASEDCSFTTSGVFDISGGRATY